VFSAPMAATNRKGLLQRYSAKLVTLAEHDRADAAMVEAHHERALAELSRIDMLKAQARDPEKSEFFAHMLVAHMSHELRTPLNAIIGFSDMIRLMLKNLPEDGKILGYADDINSAGWHLLRVINDILDLSKIEAGKLDLTEEAFDFAGMAESCARMIRGQMDEKRINFVCQIPAGLPKLFADELKLKQVLINLLSNAVKFTPADGQVTMRAGAEANGSFAIEIADTGIGIAAEDIPKVFTPFTQLNATVSRQVQGTGLGLPLARALVQLHDGTLTIASETGKGTAVTVRLPARRVLHEGSAGVERASPVQATGEHFASGD
jgi:signal transduction histidine kinase